MLLEELIVKNYSSLNENDIHIWTYISNHRKQCEKMSIDDLADQCHVSRSTILRFSKRLGLKGYAEFKVYLRMSNKPIANESKDLNGLENKYISFMKDLSKKDLSPFIKKIEKAKNIYAYGRGAIQKNVIKEIKRNFLSIDKIVYTLISSGETAVFEDVIGIDDLVLIITHGGQSDELNEFACKLSLKGVEMIVLSISNTAPVAKYASLHYVITSNTVITKYGVAADLMSCYFIFIDFLVLRYVEYLKGE